MSNTETKLPEVVKIKSTTDEAPTAEDIISINRNSLGNWHVWYKSATNE